MGLHQWHQSLETGFPKIDEYHRKLAEFLGDLDTAMDEENHEFIGAMLEQIIHHLEDTFPYEEQLMRSYDYPMLEDHLRVHASFLERMNAYLKRHKDGENIARKLTYDIKIWLTNHIQLQDGDYAAFINKKIRNKGFLGWFRRLTG